MPRIMTHEMSHEMSDIEFHLTFHAPHVKFGRNYHRKDVSHFNIVTVIREIRFYITPLLIVTLQPVLTSSVYLRTQILQNVEF